VLLFSLVSGLLVLAPSVYMLEVYDRVVNSRSHLTLGMLTLAVLGAYAVMEALEWVRSQMLQQMGHEMDRVVAPKLFDLVFESRLRRLPGGQLQTLQDWRTLREFAVSPFVTALMELPVAVVFLLIVWLISPVLGWLTLASALLQVLVAWATERKTQPALKAANRSAASAQQYADGALRNAELVLSMGMLTDIHRRWLKRQREFLALQAQASRSAGVSQALSRLIQQALGSALLGLSAWLLLKGQFPGGPGLMIVASIIGGRVLTPLVQMVTQWRAAVGALEAWQRLRQVVASWHPRPAGMSLPAPKGRLSVEALVAAAPVPPGVPSATILKGLQFSLAPGEMLAVIGSTSAGKSTLARMLVGLWQPASGKVRLDGADVSAWNKNELGPHLGYLPQEVDLFEGSLAQNIARFGPLDASVVQAAALQVGLHEMILALEAGYDTLVGREGEVLSGGQRQRVGLARALYGNPALVVLDEPNSSLDEAGDAALLMALSGLKSRGATVVVMTHRMNLLAQADKILVLVEGSQQAFGPRDEVLGSLQKAAQQAEQRATQAARPTSASLSPTAGLQDRR
jgi:ATP-binding cassette subfamily C exporter for protease/lipase